MKHQKTKIMKLSELIEVGDNGIIKGPLTNPSNEGEGPLVPMISIKDLKNGIITLNPEQRRTLKDPKNFEKSKIREKDLLVSMRGDFRSAIVHSEATGYIINQNLVGLRLNNKMLPEVLVIFLNGKKGQQQLIARSKGTTIPSITIRDLLIIQVPVPSIEIQKVLVKYFTSIQEYTNLVQEENELINKMMDSVVSNYLE
jgi:restriction endonuclease S subunit